MRNSLQFPIAELEVIIGPMNQSSACEEVLGRCFWRKRLMPSACSPPLHALQHSPFTSCLFENWVVVGVGGTWQTPPQLSGRAQLHGDLSWWHTQPGAMRGEGIPPLWSSPQNPSPQSNHGKNIRQVKITGILQNTWPEHLQTVKGIKKGGGGDWTVIEQRDPGFKISKCNVVFWFSSRNRKRTLGEKLVVCR